MKPGCLFRCDCDGVSGYGHFSRSLSLARAVLGAAPATRVAFAGSYDGFALDALWRHGIARVALEAPGFDAAGAAATARAGEGFGTLVVDTYLAGQGYMDALGGRACKLAVIDDMHALDLARADLVICFRAGAEGRSYGARKEALGLRYLVVKPELRPIREKNLAARPGPLREVLVAFTGQDGEAASLAALVNAVAAALPQAAVRYITKDGKPLRGTGEAIAEPTRQDIESLYGRAHLIVTGGGLVKYESAYCAIPSASLSRTALQLEDSRVLAARGLTLDLGAMADFRAETVREALAVFASDPGAQAAQRRAFGAQLAADSTGQLAGMLLSLHD